MDPTIEQIPTVRGLNPVLNSPSRRNSVIIAVSVGAEYHEGKQFLALIKALNKLSKKITACTIVLGDTLQRHNYILNSKISKRRAFIMSQSAGDQWIVRNSEYLEKLELPYQVKRWNLWLNDPNYKAAFSKISILFAQDPIFQKKMEYSISKFSSRFKERYVALGFDSTAISPERLGKSCFSYFLEELAIIMYLWPSYNPDHCEHILYPAKMTEALEYAYQKIVARKDLFRWNHFTFKKRERLANAMKSTIDFTENNKADNQTNKQKKQAVPTLSQVSLVSGSKAASLLVNPSYTENFSNISMFAKKRPEKVSYDQQDFRVEFTK